MYSQNDSTKIGALGIAHAVLKRSFCASFSDLEYLNKELFFVWRWSTVERKRQETKNRAAKNRFSASLKACLYNFMPCVKITNFCYTYAARAHPRECVTFLLSFTTFYKRAAVSFQTTAFFFLGFNVPEIRSLFYLRFLQRIRRNRHTAVVDLFFMLHQDGHLHISLYNHQIQNNLQARKKKEFLQLAKTHFETIDFPKVDKTHSNKHLC